jgi:regulatory protein
MMKLSKQEALERLRCTCSKSEKCLYDVKKKLIEWDLSEEFESITQDLLRENFINESRFAHSFANDKMKFSKWGKQKVRYHLRMKGIEDKEIEVALKTYPLKEYTDMISKELTKKAKSIKDTDPYKRTQKLIAFAANRGYESDIVRNLRKEIE